MFMKSFIITLTILFAFKSFSNYHEDLFKDKWSMVASIKVSNIPDSFAKISKLDIDIAGVDHKEKIIDVLINDLEYKILQENNFLVIVKESNFVNKKPDQEYKDSKEIEDFLFEIHSKFPELTYLTSIGKSVEGRDIWAIKISDNPEKNETREPAVLFNSMHHAREIMTPEVSIDIIEYLLKNYASEKKVSDWINNSEIWVIPMLNVDGNNRMWTRDRWWRKNTRGGHGVDLNRNYPYAWNKCRGSSGSRFSQTYRGPSPGSEPETKAMMNFISRVRPVFDISYHAYSELVIYPFGCSPDKPSSIDVVESIGKELAKKLNYKAGTAWELLYNADGGDIDWMYSEFQVIPYVIELNSRKQGFHPDYGKWRDITVKKNRVGWMHLLDRVQMSGLRGRVFDGSDYLKRFTVEVFAKKGQKVNSYKSHADTGIFHLVLKPGTYKINILSED